MVIVAAPQIVVLSASWRAPGPGDLVVGARTPAKRTALRRYLLGGDPSPETTDRKAARWLRLPSAGGESQLPAATYPLCPHEFTKKKRSKKRKYRPTTICAASNNDNGNGQENRLRNTRQRQNNEQQKYDISKRLNYTSFLNGLDSRA